MLFKDSRFLADDFIVERARWLSIIREPGSNSQENLSVFLDGIAGLFCCAPAHPTQGAELLQRPQEAEPLYEYVSCVDVTPKQQQ